MASGGDENVKCFFREEGFHTGISNVIKAGASCQRTSMQQCHLVLQAFH
jgi:hypothetical protein